MIILAIILVIYFIDISNYYDNILQQFTNEYLNSLNKVPEPIFDFNIGNYSDLINELEEKKKKYYEKQEQFNNLSNHLDDYIVLIEEYNEMIMELRQEIDKLKEQIANNNNFLLLNE